MNQNTYNSQLYPSLAQGRSFGGQIYPEYVHRPGLLEVQRQYEASRRTSTMKLWEVLKQVDSTLNEEEAKCLAERYTVIQ